MCVLTAAFGRPALGLARSETSLLAEGFKGSTHMCVCVLTAAIGRSTLDPWVQP